MDQPLTSMQGALDSLPTIAETIKEHGLAAKKSLGQNFILDLSLTRKIARQAAPFKDESVLEIGPGPGALTRGLLYEGVQNLTAFEKDERCIAALQPLVQAGGGALTVQDADALNLQLKDIGPGPFKIVANLPYNISTLLLIGWLEEIKLLSCLVLMFQKEVAERINAIPRTKSYGRLSVLCQLRFKTRIAFEVPPHAFKPAPKVTSAIIVLKPKEEYPTGPLWEAVKTVSRCAFAQRRKMLRKNLTPVFKDPCAVLAAAGIAETARAEELSPHQFVILATAFLKETQ